MLPLVRRLIVLSAVLLCACGGGPSEPERVRATVDAFRKATAAKDYDKLCKQILAPALVEKIKAAGLPCEVALEKGLGSVKDPKVSIGAIAVHGDTATANVLTTAVGQKPARATLRLTKVDGEWRLASLA
jgi:ketosteroid isomerase-like protein